MVGSIAKFRKITEEELKEWEKEKRHKWVCTEYTGKPVVFELPKDSMNPLKRGGTIIIEGIPGEDLLGSLETNVPMHVGFKIVFHFMLDLKKASWLDRNIWEMFPYVYDYAQKGYALGLDPWSLQYNEIVPTKKYRLVITDAECDVKLYVYNFEEEGE